MRVNKKIITAIEFGDNSLKIVAGENGENQVKIIALDRVSLATDERAAAKELHSLLSKNKILGSDFLINFPRHLATIKSIKLPGLDERDIMSMAELQALKFLPYREDEIVTSYRIIGSGEDGYTEILLAVTQRSLIEKYLRIIKHAPIAPLSLCLSCEGIFNWYLNLGLDYNNTVALVDIDSHKTHIQVARGKSLAFSRSVTFYPENAQSNKDHLIREIKLSLDTYEKEAKDTVSEIILSSAEKYSSNMRDIIAGSFSIPCNVVAQWQNIKFKDSAGNYREKMAEASYVSLLGLILNTQNIKINLLPKDILRRNRELLAKSATIKSAILIAAIIFVTFGIIEIKASEKIKYLKKIEARIESMESEVKRLAKLKENAELISKQISLKGSSIDVLREIYRILPADTSITLFEFDDSGRVLIRGTAKGLAEVFNLLPALEKSEYFENVKVNYANKRIGKHGEIADFEIISELTKF